jgi:hypothetical protein
MVREGVGAVGRNDPSLVCTYEFKIKKEKKNIKKPHYKKRKTRTI